MQERMRYDLLQSDFEKYMREAVKDTEDQENESEKLVQEMENQVQSLSVSFLFSSSLITASLIL